MRRNIPGYLAGVLILSAILYSCSKEQTVKPETDPRVDAIVYAGQWHANDTTDYPAACVMFPDMSKKTVLYFADGISLDKLHTPMVTVDGEKVLICSDILTNGGYPSLNIWDLSADMPRLFSLPGFDVINAANPIVTPDSSRIVYVNLVTNAIEIVNIGGANHQVLCPGDAAYPSVTPDGKKIVFQRTVSAISDVYSMDIDGGNLTKITAGDAATSYTYPRVVSNEKIIYVKENTASANTGNMTICVAGLSGMNETVLVPDGKYKLPSTNKAGNKLLYWNELQSAWILGTVDAGNKVSTLHTINGTFEANMLFCRILPKYVSGNPTPKDE